MTEKTFQSKDGKSSIHYYVWEPAVQPKAVLQIVHGMAEHILRYADFAEYMASYGVLVCGNDHIGHGRSADEKDWGYFGEDDGWKVMIQDMEQLHSIMKVQYMDIPYFILGHSMGSFITRSWLSMIGRGIDGAIIMGTSGPNSAIGIAKPLVATLRKTQGSRHISKTVTGMAFGSYNKRIKPQRTDYDWLTRDNSIVDKYIEDPACGFTFTLAGYADLFNLIGYSTSSSWYSRVPKDLPILIVSGMEDPVGAYGKGPAEVAEGLEDAGCEDVSLILYEDMRHEILNELGKETVYEDIRRFVLDEEALEAGERADAEHRADVSESAQTQSEDLTETIKPEDPIELIGAAKSIESTESAELIEPTRPAEPIGTIETIEFTESIETNKEQEQKTVTDEKIFYDTQIFDEREDAEKAFSHAEDHTISTPDFSGVEDENVPHRGVRKVDTDFDVEWNRKDHERLQEAAPAQAPSTGLDEGYSDSIIHHNSEPKDTRTADEIAFAGAIENHQNSPDFSGEEHVAVKHRGVRWLVDGYEPGWDDPKPVVGPARGEIKKAYEKAAELAVNYEVPDNVKRLADKAEALAKKYNG